MIICHQWEIQNGTGSVIFSLIALLRLNITNSKVRKKASQLSNVSASTRTKLPWAICSSHNALLLSDSSWWTSRACYKAPMQFVGTWVFERWPFRQVSTGPQLALRWQENSTPRTLNTCLRNGSESRHWAASYCFRNNGANYSLHVYSWLQTASNILSQS